MSKNLTRKGLAFGALVALGSSLIAGAPASAAGLDNTATLLPASGFSGGYAVPASAAQTFSLKYTTTNAAGATIKFKVTDVTGKIEPAYNSAGRTALTIDPTTSGSEDQFKLDAATDTLTLKDYSASSVALSVGDVIVFDDEILVSANKLAEKDTPYTITAVDGATFSFKTDTAYATAASSVTSFTDVVTNAPVVKVIREARASDNSYVIDTGVATSSSASNRTATVVFKSADGASYTRSALVQGWTDDANLLNDRIDTIESVSEEREIKFVKVSEIVANTTLVAPNVGDTSLSAEVTTTPVLNGAQIVNNGSAIGQIDAADFIRVLFTRQDSATKWASDSASQSLITGAWTASASMAVGTADASWSSTSKKLTAAADWGFSSPASPDSSAIAVAASGVVTVTTASAHGLRSGDKITMVVNSNDADITAAAESSARTVTVTSATTFTYTVSETTAPTAASDSSLDAGTEFTVATYGSSPAYLVGRVFTGAHSAQALLNTNDSDTDADEEYTATGAASSTGTLAVAAADIKFTTAGSATLQGSSTIADNATVDAYVKSGTTSATVTATVLDVDGAAVGAGRSVAFTVTRSASTITVNTKTASGTAVTDANGQVTFTVANTLGLAGDSVTIDATAEGVSGSASDITLTWADQAFTLYDLANSAASLGASRTVAAGTVQTLELLVADQWGTVPADGTYRVRLAGAGVTEGFQDFVSGKTTVKVTDTKVATSIASTIALQKKNTAGTFADVDASAFVLTTTTTTAGALTLGADATSLYASATVDLSDAVAAKDLVARDSRTSFTAQPAYTNDVVVAGKVTNASTGANQGNSVVTISDPNTILFSNGAVDKLGGLTLIADANGEFAVTLYSTTAQKDTVITVKANGVEKTVKVSFTGVSTTAKKLTVTANAATYIPGQAVLYTVKLTDTNGNPVNTDAPAATPAAAYISVSYAGPGLISGSLPVETDAAGEATVRIVTGVVDTQAAVLTVKYDQNYDGDFADEYDLTVSSSVAAYVAPAVVAPEVKTTIVGVTKAIRVRVENAKGEEVEVVVNGKTVAVAIAGTNSKLWVLSATKGAKSVKVYVDGDLAAVKTVTVK